MDYEYPSDRDLSASIQLGSLVVAWNAEGASWSPDVADDLGARVLSMFREALKECIEWNLIGPEFSGVPDGSDTESADG